MYNANKKLLAVLTYTFTYMLEKIYTHKRGFNEL